MRNLFLGLAAFAAILVASMATTGHPVQAATSSSPDLRVSVACSPLTNSQAVVPGDTQLCRMKFANYSAYPIANIVIARPSVNTLTNRYAYNSPSLSCDNTGCAPFTLAPGQIVYVFEEMVFNPAQDGRGRTMATADGVMEIVRAGKKTVYDPQHSYGFENSSLP